jgi:hypothetical protein
MRTLFLTLTTCLFVLPVQAKYSGGSGTAQDPYQIATAADLMALGNEPNDYDKHFLLTADIDLDPNLPGRKVFDRAVIAPAFTGCFGGYCVTDGTPFVGTMNGNGHAVLNLRIAGYDYLGLFGYLGLGAEVRDLGVVDVHIFAPGSSADGWNVGGLAGYSEGYVTACHTTGVVRVSGHSDIGGLVGCNGSGGTVTQCYSTAAVTGEDDVGGLVGCNYNGSVIQCYSTGAAKGNENVGGLTGIAYGGGCVTQCYSTGQVSGNSDVGGLVGGDYATVSTCFWDIDTSGQTASAAGTGLTTAQMRDLQTYLAAGWDLVGEIENGTSQVWQIPEGGGYPSLSIFNGYKPPRLQGLGTAGIPYRISNVMELGAMVSYSPHAHYRLGASIDLSGIRWGTAPAPWFAGAFDGNDLVISHLTIRGGNNLGLFGRLDTATQIKNLMVTDVNIVGLGYDVGGLAGLSKGTIAQCSSTGSVGGAVQYIGGLVGRNDGGILVRCCSTATVKGVFGVGGLVGLNTGTVDQCCAAGPVSGNGSVVGGLVGGNGWLAKLGPNPPGSVTHCYCAGPVSGNRSVGGLVGYNYCGSLVKCYSSGAVSGGERVGGLVGWNLDAVAQCFWDTQASGQMTSDGGTGKTTAEIQTARTFVDAGWDFVGETANGTEDIWKIAEGLGYPRLSWEKYSGGSGEPNDPYQIATAADLIALGETPADYDKHFILTADIDLDPNLPGRKVFDKAVIAPDTDSNDTYSDFQGATFTGVFDGDGHTISHLTINGKANLGLFGRLAIGEIRDVGLVDIRITGSGEVVAGLVALNIHFGTVTRCYSTGVVSGKACVGGLVGYNSDTVTECYTTAIVSDAWGVYEGQQVGCWPEGGR